MDAYITGEAAPAPGYCATCATTVGPFLDLGINYSLAVEESRIGAIMICQTCFSRLASLMGYEPVRDSVGNDKEESLIADPAIKLLENFKNAIDELTSNLSSIVPDDDSSFEPDGLVSGQEEDGNILGEALEQSIVFDSL